MIPANKKITTTDIPVNTVKLNYINSKKIDLYIQYIPTILINKKLTSTMYFMSWYTSAIRISIINQPHLMNCGD